MAMETVFEVEVQAKLLTSTPRVRMCGVLKIVRAWAVRKAMTTPEPGPTSRINGVGWEGVVLNLEERKAVSEGEERVSRRRNESSAGS